MVYSDYTKLRILFYHFKGYRAPTIARLLEAENIPCTRENALCKKGCYTRLYNIVIQVVIQYLLYTLRIIVYNCV